MDSIFNNLLKLKSNSKIIPLEDFFTEIFAYLLKSSDKLLYNWLEYFSIPHIEYDNSLVSIQESFDALDQHLIGSKPDILIELSNKNKKQVIVIESKIDSIEGNNQLSRYAEQLDDMNNIDLGVLIYITRDYDKKEGELIFHKCKKTNKLKFKQLRWYKNYQFLKSNQQNVLIEESLKFMEVNNLSLNNKFSNIDILALTNFPKVRKMMDETMLGDVSSKFESIAKGISQSSSCMTQFRDHNRYIYYHWQTPDFWVGFGYWVDPSSITNYPEIGIIMEVTPNAKNRAQIIEIMTEIEKMNPEKWIGYKLTDAKAWSSIKQSNNLQNFIHKPDHIVEIQTYFLEMLDNLNDIKNLYPNLPWKD